MTQQNITIETARKKLGSRAENMKDQDIQEILDTLYLLCDQTVTNLVEKHGKELHNAN